MPDPQVLETSPGSPSLAEDVRQELADLAALPVAGWSFTSNDSPANASVEDGASDWSSVSLPHEIAGVSTAWFRADVETPATHGGWSLEGAPLTLLVSVRHYAEVYVNGRYITRIHRGQSRVVLTRSAQPGQVFHVALRVSGPGARQMEVSEGSTSRNIGMFSAALESGALDAVRAAITDHLDRLDVSRRMTDVAGQGEYVLEQAAQQIDRDALRRGDADAVLASIERANEALTGLDDLFKRYTISLTSNAHIDMAWLWDREETKQVCHDTFRSVLDLMKEYPDFIFAQSQPQAFAWVEEKWPEMFEEIRQRVDEGRWELVGGMWVEPDCNLPNGESFVRQVLHGKRYFMQKFGKDVTLGWNPDSFGYNWAMPQVYKKSGITAFLTQKLTWNDTNVWPHRAFWWESADGSRIFSYFPTDYVGHVLGQGLIRDLAFFSKATGFKRTDHLFGIGDHGGGPTRDMLDRAEELRNKTPFPAVRHQRAHDFVETLVQESEDPNIHIPVWRGELYLEYHRGTFTSQAAIKKGNRDSEKLLRNVETFSVLAGRFGLPYPGETLDRLWKLCLFNQFHDILPGSCIGAAARDAAEDYAQIRSEGGALLDTALQTVAAQLATEADGATVAVFNPLNYTRDGIASVPMDQVGFTNEDRVRVAAPGNNEVPSQIVDQDGVRTLLFLATDVPGTGVAAYTVTAALPDTEESTLSASDTLLENEFVRVEINPDGTFGRVYDKTNDRDVLEPGKAGNVLQAFVDIPGKWEAWEIDKDFELEGEDLTNPVTIQVLESGPVRARVRTTRQWRASTFVQDIVLTVDSPRVDIVNTVDWQDRRILLKALFPVNVQSNTATYEVPYSAIERSTGNETSIEKAQFEVPALQWADMSADGYGVALLNDCKHGHDIKGNRMRLTVLRAPNSPDPQCDRGLNVFTYSLYPHAGDWREGAVYREAHAVNDPLIARATPAGSGTDSAISLVEIGGENVLLSACKKAEDTDEVIVRFFETAGRDGNATLTFANAPAEAWEADMMENNIASIPVSGNTLTVPLGHNEVKTLKVRFA